MDEENLYSFTLGPIKIRDEMTATWVVIGLTLGATWLAFAIAALLFGCIYAD